MILILSFFSTRIKCVKRRIYNSNHLLRIKIILIVMELIYLSITLSINLSLKRSSFKFTIIVGTNWCDNKWQ